MAEARNPFSVISEDISVSIPDGSDLFPPGAFMSLTQPPFSSSLGRFTSPDCLYELSAECSAFTGKSAWGFVGKDAVGRNCQF